MSGVISALMFSAPMLNAFATDSASVYQRQACNLVNSSTSNAVSIGTLETDQTQLDVGGQVMQANAENYYKFTLKGDSLKMDLRNVTNSSDIKAQILDSSGTVIADEDGTADQKAAYDKLTSWDGLKADAGDYYVKVSYGNTASKADPQAYMLSLFSGTQFNKSFQTTATSQTSINQKVLVDNTLTFMTDDAKYYSNQQYHRVNETVDSAINIGWLYENKGALNVTSKVTNTDSNQYYTFAFQKGSALKMAFNNTTGTTNVRVQLTDSTGLSVFADNYGTAAQKKAFEKLTSSDGLKAKPGQYSIKVTYAQNADRTKSQNYSLTMFSGDTYSSLYKTSASAENYDTAKLNGTLLSGNYDAASAAASYLYDVTQGSESDIFSVLQTLA